MSRRLSRYAESRRWKPFRADRTPRAEPPPPQGELWIVDANTHEQIERVYEKDVDKEPDEG